MGRIAMADWDTTTATRCKARARSWKAPSNAQKQAPPPASAQGLCSCPGAKEHDTSTNSPERRKLRPAPRSPTNTETRKEI